MKPARLLPALLVWIIIISAAPTSGQTSVRSSSSLTDISLNGTWQTGLERHYSATNPVPGLAQDSAKVSPGTLWYRRTVKLPSGDWQQATLTLNGARFHPSVYINGELVGSSEGGMAPIVFPLPRSAVAPGRTITLEIALLSLKQMSPEDASTVPTADLWRSNVSSGLWDDVSLHFSGSERLTSVIPFTDFAQRILTLHWRTENSVPASSVSVEVISHNGNVLAQAHNTAADPEDSIALSLPSTIQTWSPLHPNLYRLRVTLLQNGRVEDTFQSTWALKSFSTHDRRFFLNGNPIELLGGTVVWQRLLRQPDAADVAWSTDWFQRNVTGRLKSYGANTLRWHLGLPPERLLDLCDREGLMVQLEWPFFHSISASVPSMESQWTAWLTVAMRHPSVVIVHPWNEVGGSVDNGWQAINAILPDFPPLVVAHRDTIHIHKYWWSLFENLGLYYDSASQFDKTVMVDEFGGNYLDWKGDPGAYPSTRESFLRFLGPDQTRAERLQFQAESNARVAEYWRRIGAAGILPFCILGGPQDGSSWFLGNIHDPQPMPVWDSLAAAWSPVSLSLDVWDRNYVPGQHISVPLYLFNDTDTPVGLRTEVQLIDLSTGAVVSRTPLARSVAAHSRVELPAALQLPARTGNFRLQAVLLNPPSYDRHPVVSSWDIRALTPTPPKALAAARVALLDPEDEPELRTFLRQNGIPSVPLTDPSVNLILGSAATWKSLNTSSSIHSELAQAVKHGVSIVLLDIGPRDLGEGYRAQALGSLDGAPVVRNPYAVTVNLFDGVRLTFSQLAEPESHIQRAPFNRALWAGLPPSATWLWNGLRGGLIAPAADMEVSGLSQAALIAQWQERGADPAGFGAEKSYYAYELAGYYAFSTKGEDTATENALRARVRLLAQDAPALKDVINPDAAIAMTDLAAAWRDALNASAQRLLPLSTCGKNLTRTEIVELVFAPAEGRLILSQALTAGRLVRGSSQPGPYGMRYDPAAEQFTLNMLAQALQIAP
jgi:beta-galactosidase